MKASALNNISDADLERFRCFTLHLSDIAEHFSDLKSSWGDLREFIAEDHYCQSVIEQEEYSDNVNTAIDCLDKIFYQIGVSDGADDEDDEDYQTPLRAISEVEFEEVVGSLSSNTRKMQLSDVEYEDEEPPYIFGSEDEDEPDDKEAAAIREAVMALTEQRTDHHQLESSKIKVNAVFGVYKDVHNKYPYIADAVIVKKLSGFQTCRRFSGETMKLEKYPCFNCLVSYIGENTNELHEHYICAADLIAATEEIYFKSNDSF